MSGLSLALVVMTSAEQVRSGRPAMRNELPSRSDLLDNLKTKQYDVLIIGGGATGTGIALDAVTRGLTTALVERDDFAAGTSSRSSKLIHGGVRYLEKAVMNLDIGQYHLVRDALRERRHMMSISPHLTTALPIIVPIYDSYPLALVSIPYYWLGMKAYDMLAGKEGVLGPSYYISRDDALNQFPMLREEGLKGGIVYYDGLQNDARMNMSLALTAITEGADIVNHVEVVRLLKDESGVLNGATVVDKLTDKQWDIRAKIVINATGPFSDFIRRMDNPYCQNIICPSAGVHITLHDRFSPHDMGLLIPKTTDGRVLFFLPWEGSTIAGTTDEVCAVTDLPTPTEKEIEFILKEVSQVLNTEVQRSDVESVWSGIRPLAKLNDNGSSTAAISRDHVIEVNEVSGLVSIAGGKWTTYRSMAEDTINRALLGRTDIPTISKCLTPHMKLVGAHSWTPSLPKSLETEGFDKDIAAHLSHNFGDRAFDVARIAQEEKLTSRLVPGLAIIEAEIIYACRKEYGLRAADVLARRTRLAFLNGKFSAQALPRIIELMGTELKWSVPRRIQEFDLATQLLRTMDAGISQQTVFSSRDSHLAVDFRRVDALDTGFVSGADISAVVFGSSVLYHLSAKQSSELVAHLQAAANRDQLISLPTFVFAASMFLDQASRDTIASEFQP